MKKRPIDKPIIEPAKTPYTKKYDTKKNHNLIQHKIIDMYKDKVKNSKL